MKKPYKEIMVIAAGLAAAGALGILLTSEKGNAIRKKLGKLGKLFSGECSRDQLQMVKEKLEKHKTRLEVHLQKINSKLNEFETKA